MRREPGRTGWGSALRGALAATGLVAVCACVPVTGPVATASAPMPAPVRPAALGAPLATPAQAAARVYYAQVQAQLLSQGLLRTDTGGQDAPYTDRMLAENFIRVALYDEYQITPAGPVQRESASRLRRWAAPVRVGLRFGASVPAERRATDTARVGSYLARLQDVTGHPIALSDAAPNFFVWIVGEDERRALGPVISRVLPSLGAAEIGAITEMPPSTYCVVYALASGGASTYSRAFAVVRAEHPDLLRLSCLHEEIAQGLGLANDSPRARPSIFNDDEEFALLTPQDEAMLRMLYDPALRPGMSEAEARPIIQSLAARMVGGDI